MRTPRAKAFHLQTAFIGMMILSAFMAMNLGLRRRPVGTATVSGRPVDIPLVADVRGWPVYYPIDAKKVHMDKGTLAAVPPDAEFELVVTQMDQKHALLWNGLIALGVLAFVCIGNEWRLRRSSRKADPSHAAK